MPEREGLQVLRVPGRDDAWEVLVDGHGLSLVDLADPARLDYAYMRAFGAVLDGLESGPLRIVHVGGAACTMVRFVQATRPGSRQLVQEPDVGLLVDLLTRLPLPGGTDLRTVATGGVAGVTALPDDSVDAVLVDALVAGRVPAELTTREFLLDVDRVLAPSGVLMANLGEAPGSSYVRRVLATLAEVFAHRVLVGHPTVMYGERFGNLVPVASQAPLDVEALVARTAAFPHVQGVMRGHLLDEYVDAARPLSHADSLQSPNPAPPPPR